jgi:hypothetical protein
MPFIRFGRLHITGAGKRMNDAARWHELAEQIGQGGDQGGEKTEATPEDGSCSDWILDCGQ